MNTFGDLIKIVARLRSKDGCPWDREQTFETMKKCLEEETQEVFQAIDSQDMENLCEELGDVLLQVVMNSQIAAEEGFFTIEDVIDGLCRKMIRRHPHVFGDKQAASPEESLRLWKQMKEQEKAEKEKKTENGEKP
ncbi:MAG: MazG family protein [Lachnospiraceae bacterium]|jgi:tetrapyrrole methylase family protein/MazG family protein|nr:MazG family protein [Lachnospiraceae bacterium]